MNEILMLIIKLKMLFENIWRFFNQTSKGVDLSNFGSPCTLFINFNTSCSVPQIKLIKKIA